MIRLLTLAAIACVVAAPAAAQSMSVSTAGKSAEQLHADITKAAKRVCNRAVVGASFPREMFNSCYKATVANAVTQAGDPAVATIAGIKLAQR